MTESLPPTAPAGLRIGFVPGVTLTKWRRIWGERFPGVELEVTEVSEADQRTMLIQRAVDMCFARLPIDRADLHAIPLYDEVPVVWMSKDFLLAALDEVRQADLTDFRVIEGYDRDSLDLAVYSAAALRVPLSIARTQSRRDMVHREIVDGDPTTVALAWRTDNENPWIEEFIGVVRGRTPNSSRTERERSDKTPSRSKAADPTRSKTARSAQAKGAGATRPARNRPKQAPARPAKRGRKR